MALQEQFKARLCYSKTVTEEQLAEAEAKAAVNGQPFDHALVSLGFTNYEQLGNVLAELTQIEYKPILSKLPSHEVTSIVSSKWASKIGMFPMSFDRESRTLGVAIHSPEVAQQVRHLFSFLMEPFTLSFSVASQAEIQAAIEKAAGKSKETEAEKAATIEEDAPPPPVKQRMALFNRDARTVAVAAPQAVGRAPAEADEMGHYLVTAASLLVAAHLGESSTALNEARVRARYCQLLATRLALQVQDINRLMLASWLSSLFEKPTVIKQFQSPYNLDEVLAFKETPKEDMSPEAKILSLVSAYENLRQNDPDACKEVNLTRRGLHLKWSSSQADQGTLETFLQILMDEQFLSKLDKSAGKILVVDRSDFSASNILPLLINDGFEVFLLPTADAAWESISQHAPDLVISDIVQPHNAGLVLCKKARANPATARLPFLVVMAREEEKRAAECMRVGVDDFILKPIDPELLFLKLHRLMRLPAASESVQNGVSGKLEDMSFTDMIQILSVGARSMEVDLLSQGKTGKVFLKEGNVVHAAAGSAIGEEAFYQLMKWREGSFTTKPCVKFPEATIGSSTTSLLMEGSRLADEDGAEA